MTEPRHIPPRKLAREIARALARRPALAESPWNDPRIRLSLALLVLDRPLLAEILREVADRVDPPTKRPGPKRSPLREREKRDAVAELAKARQDIRDARNGDIWNPDTREALALRLDANTRAAVLAYSRLTRAAGPLSEIPEDAAVRHFNTASKGTKPRGFVHRRTPRAGANSLSTRKERSTCPADEIPNSPREPASVPASHRYSSAAPTSRRSPASPKATSGSKREKASLPRPSASKTRASSSTSSSRGSNGSAATHRTPPRRRRKEPDD